MRDILGREVKDGDLVVAKGTGRYNNGMHLGIWIGKSVRFLHYSSSYNQVFLVETPSENELKYKQKILDIIEEEQKQKDEKEAKKKQMKRIPKKELEIGQEYITDSGRKYFYLGNGSVIKESTYRSCKFDKDDEFKGLLFTDIYSNDSIEEINDYNKFRKIFTRKTMPRFVAKTDRKILLNNKTVVVEKEGYDHYYDYYDRSKYRITINLFDFELGN